MLARTPSALRAAPMRLAHSDGRRSPAHRSVVDRRCAESARRRDDREALAARGTLDGLWDWDLVRREIHFSPRWKEMLGLAEREGGRAARDWFSRTHPDDRDRLGMALAAHLEGLTPRFECEYRMRHRDGSYRWMAGRGLAVRDAAGRATRFLGSHTDITDRKALEAQALRDPVTGLANRALFLDRLSRAVEREKQRGAGALAVLVLDLDRFQLVNAALGRAAGDRLLREVAFRLSASTRQEDVVARLGDDEFAVLVEEVEDERHAVRVAARLQDAIRRPLELDGQELFPSASVGIATSLRGYPGAERLVLDAASAVVRAKARSREQVEVFDPRRHEPAAATLRLETDLRKALERGEVGVSYQPIVDLAEDRLAGFEALARWSHPSRGPVPPKEFIALAEESGLIVPLGYAVLREVCRQLRDWRDRFGADAVPPVSVNVSARQLAAPGVVETVRGIIVAADVPGRLLHLGVTESAFLEDAQAARERLAELEALGISFSLDDFGTGYSSLSLLHELPVRALKIDRSFVSGLGRRRAETVRAIVALARSLDLAVVAEGVETAEERATVEALGCRYAQGFLFGSARAAAHAASLIATRRREPGAC